MANNTEYRQRILTSAQHVLTVFTQQRSEQSAWLQKLWAHNEVPKKYKIVCLYMRVFVYIVISICPFKVTLRVQPILQRGEKGAASANLSSFVEQSNMQYLRELSRRHEALKKRIHAFRIPLSPAGQRFMGFVYFCIPVVGGYFLMQVLFSTVHTHV